MEGSIKEQLIGAWRLVAYAERTPGSGSMRFPFGEQPSGLILYTPDGYMSAQLMRPGRREFASGDLFKGTSDEYEDEAAGYIAYSGTYQVDEDLRTVTHAVFVSLFPNWIGKAQTRAVKFERGRLNLSFTAPNGGVSVTSSLTWERVAE